MYIIDYDIYLFKIDPSTFEELHKAAECLLNLQGVFYFGEDENGTEKSNSLLST
jgi:hypothetical protein